MPAYGATSGEKTLPVPSSIELLLAGLALIGALLFRSRGYTCWVMILSALAFVVMRFFHPGLLKSLHFWTAIGISYISFILINGILTAVPVVTYSPSANLGLRVGTIPLEDFFLQLCPSQSQFFSVPPVSRRRERSFPKRRFVFRSERYRFNRDSPCTIPLYGEKEPLACLSG